MYKEGSKKDASCSLYAQMPQTIETVFAKELTKTQSDVSFCTNQTCQQSILHSVFYICAFKQPWRCTGGVLCERTAVLQPEDMDTDLLLHTHTHTSHVKSENLPNANLLVLCLLCINHSLVPMYIFILMLRVIYVQLSTVHVQWGPHECRPPPEGRKCYLGVNLSDAFRFPFYWPSNLTLTGA